MTCQDPGREEVMEVEVEEVNKLNKLNKLGIEREEEEGANRVF